MGFSSPGYRIKLQYTVLPCDIIDLNQARSRFRDALRSQPEQFFALGPKLHRGEEILDPIARKRLANRSETGARLVSPVIPPRANCATKRACDFALYRERNLVERCFNQLKHFRAIATRYDKLAQLAAALILLN